MKFSLLQTPLICAGTYNNQYMVIDYKLAGSAPFPANTLWIVEQIPGYTHSDDVTAVLNRLGFWPSYNIPFFPDIFAIRWAPLIET